MLVLYKKECVDIIKAQINEYNEYINTEPKDIIFYLIYKTKSTINFARLNNKCMATHHHFI